MVGRDNDVADAGTQFPPRKFTIEFEPAGRKYPPCEQSEQLIPPAGPIGRVGDPILSGISSSTSVGAGENIEPAKRDLVPAPGARVHRPCQAEREIGIPRGFERRPDRGERADVVGGCCVEVLGLLQPADQPSCFYSPEARSQRTCRPHEQVRKSSRIVAEDDRISNSRAPPFILGRDSHLHATQRYQGTRLPRNHFPERSVTEAHRLVDRKCRVVEWKDVPPSAELRRNGGRVEFLVVRVPSKRPVAILHRQYLGSSDQPEPAGLQLCSEQDACADALACPERTIVLGER